MPAPITRSDFYLAKLCGIEFDKLPDPLSIGDKLLLEYVENGGSGSLPELANPATPDKVLIRYEAINADGEKITGTMEDFSGTISNIVLDKNNNAVSLKSGFYGDFNVSVDTEETTVTPTIAQQIIEPEHGFFNRVIVEPAPGGDIKVKAEGLTKACTTAGTANKVKGIFTHWLATKLDLRALDMSGFTSLQQAFQDNTTVKEIDATGWDVSKVLNLSYLFAGCTALERVVGLESWNTENNGGLIATFYGCKIGDLSFLKSWNTSKVNSMYRMFWAFGKSTDAIDLSGLDTSAVTDMCGMFYQCGANSVNLSGIDTKKVQSMEEMFMQCSQIEYVYGLENLDLSSITNMYRMFGHCYKLKRIDVSGWKFDTSKSVNLSYLFEYCSAIEEIVGLGTWNVKCSSMDSMFYNCEALRGTLDFSGFDTSATTTMSGMLSASKKLEGIIGFSASNKVGVSIGLPYGSASATCALKRLTFRTDIENAIRSKINIAYCSFDKSGLAEMFNTLTDVSGMGLSSSNTTITITGNPCVTDGTLYDETRAIAIAKGWTLVE